MPKFVPVLRIGLIVFGALLVVGAFVGVLTLGISTNPPPLRIVVAARDIAQGEQLRAGDYRIVEQILDPRLAQLYVQASDLPQFEGAFVAEILRRGDPVNKVKLVADDNAAALSRYSLALQDPNDVIMTLPVNPEIIPAQVAPGDYVNILFAGGAEVGTNRLPEPTPLPALPDTVPVLEAQVAGAVMTPTTAPEGAVTLPLADLMLEHVPVLDVQYQPATNISYGTDSDANASTSRSADGPISAIVVRVPRSRQTLLAFGASVSKLRFSIASPLLSIDNLAPQMGMDWGKYIALYRWKESQVAARGETLTNTLFPGTQAIAQSLAVGGMTPTATATP